MPKIEHIALWCSDLEKMRVFYTTYFQGASGSRYHNPKKGFTSYFVSFDDSSRLELMHREAVSNAAPEHALGWTHLAFSVGSKTAVDNLTRKMKEAGHKVIGEPRTTGDGYYESVVLDPEGNQIEITI